MYECFIMIKCVYKLKFFSDYDFVYVFYIYFLLFYVFLKISLLLYINFNLQIRRLLYFKFILKNVFLVE